MFYHSIEKLEKPAIARETYKTAKSLVVLSISLGFSHRGFHAHDRDISGVLKGLTLRRFDNCQNGQLLLSAKVNRDGFRTEGSIAAKAATLIRFAEKSLRFSGE